MKVNPLSVDSFAIIFSHSEGCLFNLFIVSFAVQKLLSLIRFHLFYFCFYFQYSKRWVIEDLAVIYVMECLPMLSSKRFIVAGFTFRSLIHFEFIFVNGVRKCFNFILLHVTVQFSQQPLLNRLSLPPLYIIASFVKNKVSIGVFIYLWVFYLDPLFYISVFVLVPYCFDDYFFVV